MGKHLNKKTINVYLPDEVRERLRREANKRSLSLSALLRSSAIEKIEREKLSEISQ